MAGRMSPALVKVMCAVGRQTCGNRLAEHNFTCRWERVRAVNTNMVDERVINNEDSYNIII